MLLFWLLFLRDACYKAYYNYSLSFAVLDIICISNINTVLTKLIALIWQLGNMN